MFLLLGFLQYVSGTVDIKMVQTSLENSFTYGNYCGANHGIEEILNDPECLQRLFTSDDCVYPIDQLDTICFWHDMCYRHSQQTLGFENNCDCNMAILSDYNFTIPYPIAYNLSSGTVIFDDDTQWPVPFKQESSFYFTRSPIQFAKDYCANMELYNTTISAGDNNAQEAAFNTAQVCEAASFVAGQFLPELSCTCDKKTQIKTANLPAGGCPALLANPSNPNLSPYTNHHTTVLPNWQSITVCSLFLLIN